MKEAKEPANPQTKLSKNWLHRSALAPSGSSISICGQNVTNSKMHPSKINDIDLHWLRRSVRVLFYNIIIIIRIQMCDPGITRDL